MCVCCDYGSSGMLYDWPIRSIYSSSLSASPSLYHTQRYLQIFEMNEKQTLFLSWSLQLVLHGIQQGARKHFLHIAYCTLLSLILLSYVFLSIEKQSSDNICSCYTYTRNMYIVVLLHNVYMHIGRT